MDKTYTVSSSVANQWIEHANNDAWKFQVVLEINNFTKYYENKTNIEKTCLKMITYISIKFHDKLYMSMSLYDKLKTLLRFWRHLTVETSNVL